MLILLLSLRDSPALSSARDTRQSPEYTRQSLYEYNTWQIALGKKCVGKELFVECPTSLGKENHSGKKIKKTHKNSNNRGRPPSAIVPTISVTSHSIFRVNFTNMRLVRFELVISPSHVTHSTTAPHHHICQDFVPIPHILYSTECKLLVWGPNRI